MVAPEVGKTVNILWTGGWDSTFRVLSLVSGYDCIVQPYYVLDRQRRSWKIELATIDRIIERCSRPENAFRGRILRPRIEEEDSITKNSEITANFRSLQARGHIAPQWEWLSRFARQSSIASLEFCIHKDDRTEEILSGHVREKMGFPTKTFVLADATDPALSIFRGFEFPLFELTKSDMKTIAERKGFLDILEMAWFCHTPIAGPAPCGICTPCHDAIEEGMGHRVGWRGHLRHHTLGRLKAVLPDSLKRVLRPLVHAVRDDQHT